MLKFKKFAIQPYIINFHESLASLRKINWKKVVKSKLDKVGQKYGIIYSNWHYFRQKGIHIVQIQRIGNEKKCSLDLKLPQEHPCKELRKEPPHDIAGA